MQGRWVTNHVFCDVDGTLLLWPTVPGSPQPGETPTVNVELVEALRAWKRESGGTIVLWSRGGTAHADMARALCAIEAVCIAKPDLMIDDADPMLLKKKLLLVKPRDAFAALAAK